MRGAMFIKPEVNLSNLKGKLLYYPFSGWDWKTPIKLFRENIDEFWFVDQNYSFSDKKLFRLFGIKDMHFISESLVGEEKKQPVEIRITEKGQPYNYLEPGYLKQIYQYRYREITIIFRRGYDYTSLFGPSSLNVAESRLGIFFLRGTSSEGGSNHPWNHPVPVRMLRGQPKVSLPRKLVNTLPDGGLIVTDGSLSYPFNNISTGFEFESFSKFHHMKISGNEAMKMASPFRDNQGNLFICIGYVDDRDSPTLIWQVIKKKIN